MKKNEIKDILKNCTREIILEVIIEEEKLPENAQEELKDYNDDDVYIRIREKCYTDFRWDMEGSFNVKVKKIGNTDSEEIVVIRDLLKEIE